MFDAPDLMLRLASDDAARPRVTHYDASGRIELSGRVLVNWVNKAANLLVEEFDAQPGATIVIDLPTGHWRAVYWALASWLCGGHIVVPDSDESEDGNGDGARALATGVTDAQPADVVITTSPRRWAGSGADVVAIEVAALARSFVGELAGALDEAAVLSTYGDASPECERPEPDDPALSDSGYSLSYRDVLAEYAGDRVLLPIDRNTSRMHVLLVVLGILGAGGSVVCAPADADVGHVAAVEQAVLAPL